MDWTRVCVCVCYQPSLVCALIEVVSSGLDPCVCVCVCVCVCYQPSLVCALIEVVSSGLDPCVCVCVCV